MSALPTWPIASGSLLAGFAVAEATAVRPLGGLVMIVAVGWCSRRWLRTAGVARTVAIVVVYTGSFALSHVVADKLSAWSSVVLAAAITGAAVFVLADAARSRAGATA